MRWKTIDQFIEENPKEFIMTMMELDVALAALSTILGVIANLQHAGIISD